MSSGIEVRTIEYERPFIYKEQLAAIFCDARYSFIEASTKAGKTTGCLIWLIEQAMFGAFKNYWWVAPIHAQAKMAFDRALDMIPKTHRIANIADQTIKLLNGRVLWFKSGEKPDNLFGEDVGAAVCDEASRCREEAWIALRSTLVATRGKVRVIGNVKGRKNWFYKMSRRAESGEQDMEFHRITADMAVRAGVLEKSEIDDARRLLLPSVAKQLFDAEPADDEGNPFGYESIRACISPGYSVNPAFCGGRDLAKSHDWNVGINLDRAGAVTNFERFQMPWEEAIVRIRKFHGSIPTMVDSTGAGDPVLDRIQRMGSGLFEPFVFTSRSKQMLMEGLAVAISQRKLSFPDGPIVSELESFEYEYVGKDNSFTGVRYSAPSGMHDDCVCALALAAYKHGQTPMPFKFSRVQNVDSAEWRPQKDGILI